MQSVREEVLGHARSVARGLAMPAADLLSRPEPMSIEQTLLNQSIRAAIKSNPEFVTARVLDTTGRVWGSNHFEELFTTEKSGLRHGSGAGLGSQWAPPAYTVSGGVGTIVEPVLADATGKPKVVLGYVQIGISEHAIGARILSARAELAGIALMTLFLGCVLSMILIGIFVRPIQVLSDSVRAIGEGTMVAEVGGSGNEEIDEIARAFNEITAKFRAAQGNLVEQERLQKEMQVAQEIQQSLLPRHVPELEGYEIGALYRAAKEVGGDYYDFVQVDERTVGVVVADVSGKGVPGSLVMTMIRTALRMEARGNRSASDVMARMNTFVTEDMKKGMFVTMFYVVLDSVNRVVTYASAGHNPMILYRGESDATYFLKPKGIPVGIDAPDVDLFRRTISVERLTLRQEDMLVVYTDGITEAMNPSREQFGEGRLLAAIKRYGHLTAQEFSRRHHARRDQGEGAARSAAGSEAPGAVPADGAGEGAGRGGLRTAPCRVLDLLPLPPARGRGRRGGGPEEHPPARRHGSSEPRGGGRHLGAGPGRAAPGGETGGGAAPDQGPGGARSNFSRSLRNSKKERPQHPGEKA